MTLRHCGTSHPSAVWHCNSASHFRSRDHFRTASPRRHPSDPVGFIQAHMAAEDGACPLYERIQASKRRSIGTTPSDKERKPNRTPRSGSRAKRRSRFQRPPMRQTKENWPAPINSARDSADARHSTRTWSTHPHALSSCEWRRSESHGRSSKAKCRTAKGVRPISTRSSCDAKYPTAPPDPADAGYYRPRPRTNGLNGEAYHSRRLHLGGHPLPSPARGTQPGRAAHPAIGITKTRGIHYPETAFREPEESMHTNSSMGSE